ncbi:hypothetical protein CEXT_678921 [Caerostris extrusa]|uniref:Uncharacterized protein n=1 Tax=Caerostris extrusa TaxID=172846 RepID=A0AAV4NBT7_CAEEX|nr:hypothetical protein CEXT_678921 [Caerostris extrusa]
MFPHTITWRSRKMRSCDDLNRNRGAACERFLKTSARKYDWDHLLRRRTNVLLLGPRIDLFMHPPPKSLNVGHEKGRPLPIKFSSPSHENISMPFLVIRTRPGSALRHLDPDNLSFT